MHVTTFPLAKTVNDSSTTIHRRYRESMTDHGRHQEDTVGNRR